MSARRRRGCLGRIARLLGLLMVAYAAWYGYQQGVFDGLQERVERMLYPVHYQAYILDSCARHDVDPYLVCAMIKCESDWQESITSDAGAVGLIQVMPSTATELVREGYVDGDAYSPQDLTDPRTNIEFGCAYLELAQSQLDDVDEVIASYNAGIGKVREWLASGGGDIAQLAQEYPETASYIQRVDAALGHYRELYTPGLEPR